MTSKKRRDWRAIGAFAVLTGPTVLGLGLFKYVAIGWSFLLSFNDARGTLDLGKWVGIDNYTTLLADEAFLSSLGSIGLFTLFIVPVTFAMSLGLAVLLNGITKGRAFFRTAFLIPAAVSYVVAALMWRMALFNGLPTGVANALGGLFGMEPVAWLSETSPPLYWIAVVTLRLWLQVGLYMILFLAGLQAIPRSLYEAGELDGTSRRQAFRHITLPQLRNTSVAVLLLILIAAFQAFDEFYNLFSSVQTGNATAPVRPPLVFLYDSALGDQNYGLGSAGAFVLTLIIIVVTLLQGRIVGFGKKD
ncbi:carbohydrate ABC transporter permease [Amycolatopsis umgeniensis]|uniref:Multiple sugar transport system permease protein n=1 Tax=Amycolatopsis umgeniensis TaxID=336628 RepID=A0A841AYE5_9PSEU|nr:sugar ABC transporter permease [Amycolatopsis umgeniensis]MBB5851893.1 multiple sugar transport system permease protein [Amycolatopsis umgeniensis]